MLLYVNGSCSCGDGVRAVILSGGVGCDCDCGAEAAFAIAHGEMAVVAVVEPPPD